MEETAKLEREKKKNMIKATNKAVGALNNPVAVLVQYEGMHHRP